MSTTSHTSVRPTRSCVRCAARKVKCNRKQPCETCTRHNVECMYHPVLPHVRRRRPNKQDLADRLRHCESILRNQGIEPQAIPTAPCAQFITAPNSVADTAPEETEAVAPLSNETQSSPPSRKTKVVQGPGQIKIVDNILWAVLEEYHDPQDTLDPSPDDGNDSDSSAEDLGLFMLDGCSKSRTKLQHPAPADVLRLWQVFKENVDPLTKVVHVPTLEPVIERAASNLDSVPRSLEALMFSIYAIAMMSLKDDECGKLRFSEPRSVLLPRYTAGAKAALSSAQFMSTTNIAVLQALAIFLLVIGDSYEPRAVWSLIGVAVRIAHGMGLERDGTYLGLPPFETEMRRRLWAQLKTLDFRMGELCGIAKFHGMYVGETATKWPSNISDDQLYEGMAAFPAEATTALTDAVFLSVKFEFLKCAAERVSKWQKYGKSPVPWDHLRSSPAADHTDSAALEIQERLETKYLRYCDPSQPLQLITMLMARCGVNVVRFMSHHPRRWSSEEAPTSPAERQKVWEICLQLLEQHNMLQSNPLLARFAWHASYTLLWHAIIHVLDCLRSVDSDRAWQLMETCYENNPRTYLDMRRPIHVAVGNLCLKAYSKREAMHQADAQPLPTPHFIVLLRKKLEALKRKRQRRAEQHSGFAGVSRTGGGADTGNAALSSSVGQPSDDAQTTQPRPPANVVPDQSLIMYGFGEESAGTSNVDLGSMLDQDTPDGNAAHPIDWDVWDSWLANSSILYPHISTPQ